MQIYLVVYSDEMLKCFIETLLYNSVSY